MRNPAFWGRVGVLRCVFVVSVMWSAGSAAAAAKSDHATPGRSVVAVTSVAAAATTTIIVSNSRSKSTQPETTAATHAPHAMPTLNGFSLLVLAMSLGIAALWIWRRRQ